MSFAEGYFPYLLLAALSAIALFAKHLAILDNGSASITPRSNMIALHKLDIKLLVTYGTLVILLLPNSKFYFVREDTKVEIMLITSENVWDDSLWLLDFIISHEF